MADPRMVPFLSGPVASMESLEPRLMLSASEGLTGTAFAWSGWSVGGDGERVTELRYRFDGTPRIEQAVLGNRVTLEGEEVWAVPGDPYVPVHTSRILLPQGTTVADVSVDLGAGEQIGSGVQMLSASEPVPVGQVFEGEYALENEAFPGAQPVRWSVGHVRGYTVLDLSLFPVSYAAADGSLTYYQDLRVSVAAMDAPAGLLSVRNLQADQDVVASLVDNGEAVGDYALPAGEAETPTGETVEYLIITPSSLAGAMQALADHRASFNGYGAEVVTTEYIDANYSGLRPDGGTDLQTKIRNCIIDYYTNHGTQFVVLGGDHNLVPDRNTYVEVGSYTASDMPTDLYYAGLDGDWDGDSGNEAADGVYGEAFSGIDEGDLYPDVHVGRIAVRTSQQAADYIAKVVDYELNPPLDVAGKFLLGGKQLGDKYTGTDRPSDVMYDGHVQFQDASHPTVSDAEMWQRRAYRDYVQNDENWDGQPDSTGDFAGKSWQADELGIVTDTLTSWDASSPGDYRIDNAGLSAAFNEGWNFLIFDTHGGNTVWASEGTYFNSSDALNLTGPTHFVYTGACNTNAFDKTDMALSEGFIRSVDGGALAYIGSSRYGWYSPDSPPASNYSDGGSSSRYQGRWLEEVFLNEQTILGDSFDLHKQRYAGSSGYNGSYRWLQFGLNLIGDPAIGILGIEDLPAVVTDTSEISVVEGGSAAVGVKLSLQPTQPVAVTVAATGDPDITVTTGSLTFDQSNWDTWQYVTVDAAEDPDSEDGIAQISASATGWAAALVTATEADDDVNTPPAVAILGPAVTEVQLLDTASLLVLDGDVTDDGKPDWARLNTTWTLTQGPAAVAFADAARPDTTVQFSQDGTYVLRLTADDGEYQAYDELTVTVGPAGTQAPTPELLWYRFDEGDGTQATDASGAGHDGTITDATWTDGVHGGALDFDGANDYVLDDDGELYLNGLTAFTLTSWIRADVTNVDMGWVVGRDPTNGDDTFGIRYDAGGWGGGGTDVIKAGISTDGGDCQIESSSYAQTTEWQFVALSWQSGSSMSLYLDGSTPDTITYDSGPVSGAITGATKLLVGKPPKGADWDGRIDDVRLYNRQLSQVEIQAIFEGALPNTAPQTQAGADQQVDGAQATLAGSVTDDGLPSPPGGLDLQWIQLAGPGTASFNDAAAVHSGVSVDQAGTYTFRLIATDGQVTTADDVDVQFVFDAAPPTVIAVDRNDCELCCGEMTSLAFTFDEDVSVDAVALTIYDADGAAIDMSGLGTEDFAYDAQTRTARWDLTDLAFQAGWYTAVLDDAYVSDAAGSALDGDGDGSAGGDYHSVQLVALPGDADCDGDVDADDATVLRDRWGQSGGNWVDGDFDGDGDTDLRDASALLQHYGQRLPDPQTPQVPQTTQPADLLNDGQTQPSNASAQPHAITPAEPSSPESAGAMAATLAQVISMAPFMLTGAQPTARTLNAPQLGPPDRLQPRGQAVLPQDALRWGPACTPPDAWAASQWHGPRHGAALDGDPVDLLGSAAALTALPGPLVG